MQAHERSEQVDEPGARRAGCPLEIDHAGGGAQIHMVPHGERKLGGSSDGPQLNRVVLAAVGSGVLTEVRQEQQLGVAAALDLPQLGLPGGEPVAQLACPRLGGRGVVPGALRRADRLRRDGALGPDRLDRGASAAALLVEPDEAVEAVGRAAPGEGRTHTVGLGPYQPKIEQRGLSGGGGRRLGERLADTLEVVAEHERPSQPRDLEHAPQVPLGADDAEEAPGGPARLSRLTSAPNPEESRRLTSVRSTTTCAAAGSILSDSCRNAPTV